MTDNEKLREARRLLSEVSENWKEEQVEHYGASMSFDELVAELYQIQLKN